MDLEKLVRVCLEEGDAREDQEKAIEAYKKALSFQPSLAELGLLKVKKTLTLQAEAANRLANLLFKNGKVNEAINAYLTALKFNPDEIRYWVDFGYALRFVQFEQADDQVKQAVLTGLRRMGVLHQNFANAACSLLKILRIDDPLLLALLEETIVALPRFEEWLRDKRRELLLSSRQFNQTEERFLEALARQTALNESIYDISEEERQALGLCENELIRRCYFPQRETVEPPIATLGRIENDVSTKVQQQYEEHPYPRWSSANEARPSLDYPIAENFTPAEILIAGCGTGLQAIHAANYNKDSKVLAVDLSRKSLQFAKHMSDKLHVENISFLQADILDLAKLDRTFALIECVGVLHHMEDPAQGIKTLAQLLKPQGYMNLGVYSRTGRHEVHAVRSWIREQGWEPTLDGIRSCRKALFELPDEHPFKKISSSLDFYSLSACRDLLFHVHETDFNLLELKEILDQTGLEFVRFDFPSFQILPKFHTMFGHDKNENDLKNWDLFETEFPDTFLGMYQFWVKSSNL